MTTKLKSQRYFWIVLLTFLTACGIIPQPETEIQTVVVPFSTVIPTILPITTPLPTQLPPFPLDGYIMIFEKNEDLYFQDGNNSPIQLTHAGERPHSPMISDDNQKIIFTRGDSSGDGFSNIFSVNADGSNEQSLITEQWLTALGESAAMRSLVFVPYSHKLLFNTYRCESQKYNSPCSVGIFLVDADTGDVKEFLPPSKFGQYDRDGNFKVSPNGKMVSVVMSDHIDIFDINGKTIRQDVLPYTPSTPVELFQVQSWLPDSSGVIVAIPTPILSNRVYGDQAYIVWHYIVDNNETVQIPLDSLYPTFVNVMAGSGPQINISPDGNWILYFHPTATVEAALHIGNLRNGHAQFYAPILSAGGTVWGPDSKHFGYGNHWLGTIDGPPVHIDGIFFEWLDNTHFFYVDIKNKNAPKTLLGEIMGDTILTFDPPESYLLIRSKH